MENLTDSEYQKHPKFRYFCDEVLQVLQSFDKAKEWADLIKWLQSLCKVFQKYPSFPVIPSRHLFAKRLSQCLNPALPSGVHLKALETYELVFNRIGPARLAADLAIYSTGSFPLFQYASTQVKPSLLNIFEQFYLPLGIDLFPCLTGLVTALLPGLEEEGNEFYPRVMELLDTICSRTDRGLFYRAVWKSLLITPYVRVPALNYLLARLPSDKSSDRELKYFIPERNTLVKQALIQSLQDQNLLVQRAVLDLLVVHFKLHEGIFLKDEWIPLAEVALTVVIRREVSLNRRLYIWILGNKEKASDEYFVKHSKEIILKALKLMFSQQHSVKPYKVIMALLEREELGSAIIEDLLMDILRSYLRFKEGFAFSTDVHKWISELLEVIQPSMVWSQLSKVLAPLISATGEESLEAISLIDANIDIFPCNDRESQLNHLPVLLYWIVNSLEVAANKHNFTPLIPGLQLALKVLGKISSGELANSLSPASDGGPQPIQTDETLTNALILINKTTNSIQCFYCSLVELYVLPCCNSQQTTDDAVNQQSKNKNIDYCLFDIACQLLVTIHTHFKVISTSLAASSASVDSARSLPAKPKSARGQEIMYELPDWFKDVLRCCQVQEPKISCLGIRTFLSFLKSPNSAVSPEMQRFIVTSTSHCLTIAKKLWSMLHPSLSMVHYTITELFLSIRQISQPVVSTVIADELLQNNIEKRVEGYQRFALLWRLAGEFVTTDRPFSSNLYLILDALSDEQPLIRLAGRTWLAESISKVERILDPLLLELLDQSTARYNNQYQSMYDARRVLYILRILKDIIECDFRSFMQHVTFKQISKDVLALNQKQVLRGDEPGDGPVSDFLFIPVENYIDLLIVTSLRFIQGQVAPHHPPEFTSQNSIVQISSAEFLQYLLLKITAPEKASRFAHLIQDPILQNLAQAVSTNNLVLQIQLLGLLRSIVLLDAIRKRDSTTAIPNSPSIASVSGVSDWNSSSNSSINSGTSSVNAALTMPNLVTQSAPSSPPITPRNQPTTNETVNTDTQQIRKEEYVDAICSSPMFLQTLIIGLLQNSSKNVRFYWLEFITSCLPYFYNHLAAIVIPIVNCICDILNLTPSAHDSISSKDVLLLLKSLYILLYYCIVERSPEEKGESTQRGLPDDNYSTRMTLGSPVRLIADFVKDVFQQDQSNPIPEIFSPRIEARQQLFKKLPYILKSMIQLWNPQKQTSTSPTIKTGQFETEQIHNKYAIQDQTMHIIEPLVSHYPIQLLCSLMTCWTTEESKAVILEWIKSIESLSYEVIFTSTSTILSTISNKAKQSQFELNTQSINETIVFDFVNNYIVQYGVNEGISSSDWTYLLALLREGLQITTSVSTLWLLSILYNCVKRSSPTILRSRRELQELTQRIVESCVNVAVKALESSNVPASNSFANPSPSLPRLGTNSSLIYPPAINEEDTKESNEKDQEKMKDDPIFKSNLKALSLLSAVFAPLLNAVFIDDKDKIVNIVTNSIHLILPFLKKRTSHYNPQFSFEAISLVASLCDYPFLLRAWRKDILDVFYDLDFFAFDIICFPKWSKVIDYLMSKDKSAFNDLLQRVLGKTLGPIQFLSREQENSTKARYFKRFAFVIFAGEVDQHLGLLPTIQERVVEAFKVHNDQIFIQVFLLMRVLLTRISRDKLRPFWSTVLSEMIRVFSTPKLDAQVVLGACKFLDLVLVLPSEHFNLFEWMFIADSLDFPDATPAFVPYIEQFVEDQRANPTSSATLKLNPPNQRRTQPLIVVRSVEDINQLQQYLRKFSQYTYANITSAKRPDNEFIHQLLANDFVDPTTLPPQSINEISPSNSTDPNIDHSISSPQLPSPLPPARKKEEEPLSMPELTE